MVRVMGKNIIELGDFPDFYLDKYEVTNREFKEFIDRGGYQNNGYWKHAFLKEGRTKTWKQAMLDFQDATGRPGPATWQGGNYPVGQDDYPVNGISWYEAAAYAEFVGKSLPTNYHWDIAQKADESIGWRLSPFLIAPSSNFDNQGPSPVGSYRGMNFFGAYDMAGNVREWCWNDVQNGKSIRGGAWKDATYMMIHESQTHPFDRSSRNGFRCVQYLEPEKIPEAAFKPLSAPSWGSYHRTRNVESWDYRQVPRISNEVFRVYKDQFSYDKADLNVKIVEVDEIDDDWILEKVSFDAAYDNERVTAYLYIPKNAIPPYQTVVFFPGSGAVYSKEFKKGEWIHLNLIDFLVRNGRAVVFPVYNGTYERGYEGALELQIPANSRQHVEYLQKIIKDFRRSIDYLETRDDIDSERLAYYGFSWGGFLGTIIPAVEERIKVNICLLGGVRPFPFFEEHPSVEPVNYVTRITGPTLMLNGKYDLIYPEQMSVKPMYDLLATPQKDKVLKLYDTDHFIPRNELIRETLSWLDRYFGPVQKQ